MHDRYWQNHVSQLIIYDLNFQDCFFFILLCSYRICQQLFSLPDFASVSRSCETKTSSMPGRHHSRRTGFCRGALFFLTWYPAPCYFGAICMTSRSLWYGRLTWTYNLDIRETNARHPDSANANQLSGDTVGEPNSLTSMVQSEHFCHASCINAISSAWNMLKFISQRSAGLAEIGLTNELKALAFRVKPASITSQALRKPLRT